MDTANLKSVETEIGVLVTVLESPNQGLTEGLTRDHFTFPQAEIFTAMSILDRAGKLNFPNLVEQLKKSGHFDRIGGNQKLKDLLATGELRLPGADYEQSKDNLELYRKRRELHSVRDEISKTLQDPTREFSLSKYGRKLIELELRSAMRKPFLDPWTPTECREWEMPKDYVLAGDCHITRGGITVIGGVPGCGKSRVAVALGIAGATGSDWMGLKLHSRFKTLIIQAENGPARLKAEFSEIGSPDGINLDDWIKVTPQPDFGLPLHDEEFRAELRNHLNEFNPGVIVFDPWNRVAMDDRQKDYREAIDQILGCLPNGPGNKPAVVIVAHLRKQGSSDGKKRGRDLLPELSGSGMIGSVARSVFVLEHGSPDDDCDIVVWTCAKNNDGREGGSSAWHRRNGLFTPADDFDLEKYFAGENGGRTKIDKQSVAEAIGGGVSKKVAATRLMGSTGCGKSAAYAAVEPGGRFGAHIDQTNDGTLIWSD